MDDFLRIARELGLPGVALVMGFYLAIKIGAAVYDGCAWLGPNFLNPIRDALISNISVLTQFIAEIRATLPIIKSGHDKTMDTLENAIGILKESRGDSAKVKLIQITMAKIMANKCDADKCPLMKATRDSDDYTPHHT